MATLAKAGYGGTITGLTTNIEIADWKFVETQTELDITSMGSSDTTSSAGFHDYIGGIKSGAGTFNTYMLVGTIGTKKSGVVFTSDSETITADIYLTNLEPKVDVNDKEMFAYAFETTGQYTIAQ